MLFGICRGCAASVSTILPRFCIWNRWLESGKKLYRKYSIEFFFFFLRIFLKKLSWNIFWSVRNCINLYYRVISISKEFVKFFERNIFFPIYIFLIFIHCLEVEVQVRKIYFIHENSMYFSIAKLSWNILPFVESNFREICNCFAVISLFNFNTNVKYTD